MLKDKPLALVVFAVFMFFAVPVVNYYGFATPERKFMHECTEHGFDNVCELQWRSENEKFSLMLTTETDDFIVDFNLIRSDCFNQSIGTEYTCELQEAEY